MSTSLLFLVCNHKQAHQHTSTIVDDNNTYLSGHCFCYCPVMSTALSLFLYSGIFFFFQFASFHSDSFILLFTLLRHFKVLPFCLVQPLQMLLLLFAAKLFVCTITGSFVFVLFSLLLLPPFRPPPPSSPDRCVCLCLPPLHHYLLGAVQCTLSCSCFFFYFFPPPNRCCPFVCSVPVAFFHYCHHCHRCRCRRRRFSLAVAGHRA